MLTSSGAKLLDFGLATLHHAMFSTDVGSVASHALAATPLAGRSRTWRLSNCKRREVDHRTDIFAFGALLYEMVAGRTGVRRGKPSRPRCRDLDGRPRADSRQRAGGNRVRWSRSFDDASPRTPISGGRTRGSMAAKSGGWRAASSGPARPTRRRRRAVYAVLAVAIVTALAAVAVWRVELASAPPSTRGNPPSIVSRRAAAAREHAPADGGGAGSRSILRSRQTAGSWRTPQVTVYDMRIFVRPVAGGPAMPLSTGVGARQFQPRWSPDGRQILFVTPEGAFVAPAFGGATRRLDCPRPVRTAQFRRVECRCGVVSRRPRGGHRARCLAHDRAAQRRDASPAGGPVLG